MRYALHLIAARANETRGSTSHRVSLLFADKFLANRLYHNPRERRRFDGDERNEVIAPDGWACVV